jgi:Protein of unknown function (DUF3987)
MAAGVPTQPSGSTEEEPPLEPDLGLACDFVLRWAPETFPYTTLASILPGGAPRAHTWHVQQDQPHLHRWLASKSGRENLYFTVNAPAKETLKDKPKKTDIGLLCAVWGDLDPHPDVEAEPDGWRLERDRLLALAAELVDLPWPPTVIIDSGNGIAPLWQLEAVLPNVEEHQGAIEALGRRIEKALGGIENTSNVDRLLRLPGTINLPDVKKLEKGRGPALSGIVSATWRRHSWRDLEALADHLDRQPLASVRIYKPKPNGKDHSRADESGLQDLDLPEHPPEPFDDERIASLIENNPDLIGPWETTSYPSQSERDAALASWARKHGWPICDAWALIITNRDRFGDRDDQKKALRRDYVLRTLRLAYAKNGTATPPTSPSVESSEWPEPGRIGAGIPDAPAFPAAALPEVLRQWALDQANRMQAPIDFLAIPALVTLCGCIGKAPTLRPKRFDDWAERPCLWAVLIADPGSMKSVTLKAATDPLRAVEKKKMAGWQTVHDAWTARQRERALREAAHEKQVKKMLDKDPAAMLPAAPTFNYDPEPLPPRLIAADATIEKLADLMMGSPGLSLVRDELSGWLLNMTRYNNGTDRQFFLECWSGGSYPVDRIKRGSQIVDDLYLNVCGTIQPRTAAVVFGAGSADGNGNDGFLDRFGLIAYPEPVTWELVDRWPDSAKRRALRDACERLAQTNWHTLLRKEDEDDTPHARFAPEAQERFNAWLTKHMGALRQLREDPAIGFLGKGRGTLVRLALVIHLTRWTCGEAMEASTIDLLSLEAAITLFETYLRPMYGRVVAAFGAPEGHAAAKRIAEYIRAQGLQTIRPADITKLEWQGLRSVEEVEPAFTALVAADWLAEPKQRPGPKGGRPSRKYLINPKVHSCTAH